VDFVCDRPISGSAGKTPPKNGRATARFEKENFVARAAEAVWNADLVHRNDAAYAVELAGNVQTSPCADDSVQRIQAGLA
jgi:hypothetical protein